MPKSKPIGQLGFDFTVPAPKTGVAGLAGLEKRVNAMIGTALACAACAGESREVIAAKMSEVLDEPISRAMLDAYASPARTEHKVPMSRALALLLVTDRQDLLGPLLGEIGAAVLIGEEVKTARIGHLEQLKKRIEAEMRALKAEAPEIREGGE
ncbi:hypothetical protein [Erythrobacter sp. WG]|uniref:hypothetical protein n=1 Tax=Erythrobacter sp. WG TaxID=2985510 RepID=UPI00226DD532|nr:hypothetical protein [Erythrobacter sp. WG]MCX9146590.1 hypothetical protein [Erythrobacter sp. WG]